MSKTYRLLLLGETGSGKSTFINYLANFFLGGKLTAKHKYRKVRTVIPNKLFPIVTDNLGKHSESNVKDQTQSQTTKCCDFKFVDKNGKTVELIDTPGFADTRKGQDEENIKTILSKASLLKSLTAIVLIINGSHARKTTTLKYVLNKLSGNIPDALLENLVVVFTNCDETSRNFDIKMLNDLKPKHKFHMQNNAFSNSDVEKDEKQWKRLEFEWNSSMETIEEFMETVYGLNAISAEAFKEMVVIKQALQASQSEIIVKQKQLLQAIDLIEQKEASLKQENDRAEQNKNFKKKDTIEVLELQKKSYFSTVCQKHYKEKICHENCGLGLMETTHSTHFYSCAANGGNGNCSSCQCIMNIHFHSYDIPVKTTKEEETVLKEMQAKYLAATKNVQQFKDEIDKQNHLKKNLIKEVDNLKANLIQSCKALKSLCKNFNFHEELETTVETLRKEASISQNFRDRKMFTETADAIEQLLGTDEFKVKNNNDYSSDSDSDSIQVSNNRRVDSDSDSESNSDTQSKSSISTNNKSKTFVTPDTESDSDDDLLKRSKKKESKNRNKNKSPTSSSNKKINKSGNKSKEDTQNKSSDDDNDFYSKVKNMFNK